MRFMLMVKATRDSEAGVMPSAELLSEMGKFNEELVKAGVLLAGEAWDADTHLGRRDGAAWAARRRSTSLPRASGG